jgi:hypothetical protein
MSQNMPSLNRVLGNAAPSLSAVLPPIIHSTVAAAMLPVASHVNGRTCDVGTGEGPMGFSSETETVLRAAVAGIPRVAKTIAEIPTELREPALDAVARSYQQTVRELGHTQADAQIWISAVMLRLRATLQSKKKLNLAGEAKNFTQVRG